MQILIARRPTAQNCDSYIALRYQLLQCRKRFAARFATFPHFHCRLVCQRRLQALAIVMPAFRCRTGAAMSFFIMLRRDPIHVACRKGRDLVTSLIPYAELGIKDLIPSPRLCRSGCLSLGISYKKRRIGSA
ncbi:hypothetical protein [Rhizobium tubonense]|uniref:hypothetical protein n=1 Tax=Rhizobium tubonense TaxID=484088 RepID=UPI0012B67EB1|nr:hypothetical protein [Rhizobium tubonense]